MGKLVSIMKSAFGGAMPGEAVVRTASVMEERSYKDGEYIFRQGDESDGFYIVCKGEVELEAFGSSFVVKDGETFGELGFSGDGRRLVSARARGDVVVLYMSKASASDLESSAPKAHAHLAKALMLLVRDRCRGVEDVLPKAGFK